MTFILKSEEEICATFHVTPEQIDRVMRLIDMATGKIYHQVESQSEPGITYEVRYNSQCKRLTCTCKAGQAGYGCWHRRASLAAMFESRQAENLQARLEAGDPEAMNALRALEEEENKGFQLMQ